MVSWHMDNTVLILESSRLWLRRHRHGKIKASKQGHAGTRRGGGGATHTTGNTLGKTTLASARYSYRILWSKSSVEYLTCVAWDRDTDAVNQSLKPKAPPSGRSFLTSTVSSSAWIFGSVRTSSSSRTLDSDTDTLRRCEFPILCVSTATQRVQVHVFHTPATERWRGRLTDLVVVLGHAPHLGRRGHPGLHLRSLWCFGV